MDLGNIFFIIVIFFIGFIFYSICTKHGRGRMLGGEIVWSSEEYLLSEDEVSGSREVLQVHSIKTKDINKPSKVGIELRSKSHMHIGVQPISLDVEDAKKLVNDLNEAISNAPA